MVNAKMSASSPPVAEQKKARPELGYTLAAIALSLTLAALLAASVLMAVLRGDKSSDADETPATLVLRTIGGQRYAIPDTLITLPSQRQSGFADRVDLSLPVAFSNGVQADIALTIMPRGRAIVSARLLDSVYVHQFSDQEVRGAAGLVGKPLVGGTDNRSETVWYDPLAMTPFVARCLAPLQGESSPHDCLRVAPLSDYNLAILTFPNDLLAHWREIDPVIEGALAPLRR